MGFRLLKRSAVRLIPTNSGLARARLAHRWYPGRKETPPSFMRLRVAMLMKGTLNQKKAIKLLQENGWTRSRGGRHQIKMTKPSCRPITLPQHKGRDYPKGLAKAILRQAGLR
jgi:predicted RNA binding protein YcfA (HicA-like mRNA interferase family)